MRHFTSAGVLLLLLASFINLALAEDFESLMAGGRSALENRDYASAEAAFRSALAMEPEDKDALLHLGIALSRQGRLKEAESYLKQALMKDPEDPRTNLELGRLFAREKVYEEAVDFLETAAELSPGSDYAKEARRLIGEMAGREKKRWRAAVSLGLQYDSNVVLGADGVALPEGLTRKDDWRSVAVLSAGYDVLDRAKLKGAVGYSFYQSLHYKLSRFNVQAHSPYASASYDIGDNMRLRGGYSFDYIYVGSRKYSQAHNLSPAVLFSTGKGYLTALEYKFSSTDYKDSDRFATNSDRTGDTHSVGASQLIPLASFLSLRGGYTWQDASAEASYQEYQADALFLNLIARLPYKVKAELSAEYAEKDYGGDHPLADKPREDDMQSYSLSFSKDVLPWLGLSASHLYVRNDSNILEFDYDRNVTGMMLTARF